MTRKIEKGLILIIFLYLDWFQYVFGIRQIIIYFAAVLLAALIGSEIFQKRRIAISRAPSIIKTYIYFGAYALLTGMFVAISTSSMLSALMQYFEYVFICFVIFYISKAEGSMNWILNILYFCALVCGIQTVLFGMAIRSAAVFVTTMGPTNNPNTLGIVMVFGIMAVLFDYELFQKHFMIRLVSIVVFAYVIILTGSRKAFIAMAVLLSIWAINYITYTKKRGNQLKTKGIKGFFQNFAVIIGVVAALVYVSSAAFSDTSMLSKLLLLFTNGGVADSERIPLYRQALEYFSQHPIFGIGYRQYEILYNAHIYSHSTYAEILSCTGAIGTLLFFVPILGLLFKAVISAFTCKNEDSYKYRMILLVLAVELFVAATQIIIYDLGHMTILTFLFWEFSQLENKKFLRQPQGISDAVSFPSGREGIQA
jgi:O-antigen ligase